MHCKSLWIKASAKCINVNVSLVSSVLIQFSNSVNVAEFITYEMNSLLSSSQLTKICSKNLFLTFPLSYVNVISINIFKNIYKCSINV